MIRKVLSFAEKQHMIVRGDHILAGVSGGADSVCLLLVLLDICKCYELKLTAVHVEHGIRGADSLRDASFVEELCARLGVELVVFHRDAVMYARERGMTLEEGAREMRYQCFQQVLKERDADKIAVAHNQNDCGETLLFHLARGTGLQGMRGIVPVRGPVIRPLLCVSRQEIEAFLAQRNQEYCTDATNQELLYSRNKIRHQVLPVLKEVNPGVVEHLYQSTCYVAEAVELVDSLVTGAREQCVREYFTEAESGFWPENGVHGFTDGTETAGKEAGFLILDRLSEEPPLVQKTLVLKLMTEYAGSGKDLTGSHVEQVLGLFARQVGRRIMLPCGMEAERTYQGVILKREKSAGLEKNAKEDPLYIAVPAESGRAGDGALRRVLKPGEIIRISRDGPYISARILEKTGEFYEIPKKRYTKWFDYDKIKDTLWLRTREEQDYFVMDAQGRRQSLRRYFINEKISSGLRDTIPVLAEGSHILWVIGYRISEAYKVTKETRQILEIQVYGGSIHE